MDTADSLQADNAEDRFTAAWQERLARQVPQGLSGDGFNRHDRHDRDRSLL
jgi:hypothetical protein